MSKLSDGFIESACAIDIGYKIIEKLKEELRKQGWSEERINKELKGLGSENE